MECDNLNIKLNLQEISHNVEIVKEHFGDGF